MSPRMVQLCHLGTYPFNRKVNKSDTGQMCEQTHNTHSPFHDRGIHWRQTPFCFLILRFSHPEQGLQLTGPSLERSQKPKRCTPPSALFHLLPHIQHWHLLQCIPSLCLSHASDLHTGGQICPKMH